MEASRAATADDVPRVAELVRMAIDELAEQKGGAIWRARESRLEPVDAELAGLLGRPDTCVVVGSIDGAVLGYGVARIEWLRDGSVLGVVDDIFVEPDARGIGLGEAMMGDLMAWCTSHDCIGIDAMALPGQRLTKNFFEELGFTARKLVMHWPRRDRDGPGGA
jgi:GNAT superfamily N-acetyltransferase